MFDLRMSFSDKNEEFFTVFFDGHSGRFNYRYNIKYDESYHYYHTAYHFWQLKRDILYGYSRQKARFWAADMETKKMLYHEAGGLQFQDGRQEFENFLGIH
jgi:hypothetical protein